MNLWQIWCEIIASHPTVWLPQRNRGSICAVPKSHARARESVLGSYHTNVDYRECNPTSTAYEIEILVFCLHSSIIVDPFAVPHDIFRSVGVQFKFYLLQVIRVALSSLPDYEILPALERAIIDILRFRR